MLANDHHHDPHRRDIPGEECSDSDERSDRPSTVDTEVRGRGKVTRS